MDFHPKIKKIVTADFGICWTGKFVKYCEYQNFGIFRFYIRSLTKEEKKKFPPPTQAAFHVVRSHKMHSEIEPSFESCAFIKFLSLSEITQK